METLELLSGHSMPVVGLGTWPMKEDQCKQAVTSALALDYTHFDTAYMYKNQREIGEALREAGANREELFITSKIWHDHLKYEDALSQADEILQELNMDYVDLLLIHWPNDDVPMEDTFKALKEIHNAGKARSIGVSNFSVAQMKKAREVSGVPICANQIKYHPGHEQRDILTYCQEHNIIVTAYSPLAKQEIFGNPALTTVAQAHGKTPAQIALRWLLQKNIIVIPKASSREHLQENLDVFNWKLSTEDMDRIDQMADEKS
ncbi:MAG: aldo/keto reductase [bacterium]|nr:aldo/keto reductase [bacterium]